MLAPNPTAIVSWPIAGDVPDLLAIVTDQAATIRDQEALIHAYQGTLNAAQHPAPGTPATANGAIVTATTSLPVTGTIGSIVIGATVGGTPNATPPVVLGQISGTPHQDGTYLLDSAVTLPAVAALTFTPPPPPSPWPPQQDAATLGILVATQTGIIRSQTGLLQHYQDLLNQSSTPPPPSGP